MATKMTPPPPPPSPSTNDGGFSDSVWQRWFSQLSTYVMNGPVNGANITAGTLPGTSFASSIQPVGIVSSLPNPIGYTGPNVVFLTTDLQLYRYDAGLVSWTLAIPAVNVTGQLTDAQIAALATAKLTGEITTTQITNDAITTPKISAGAVDTAQIAANAVTAGTIAAGAITTAKIAAGAVTATTIAAGTITSNEMAANSIIAGKIAVGAVSASEISVANLSAINADLGTVTAGTLQGTLIQTAAGTSDRITINESGNNSLLVYNSSNSIITAMGLAAISSGPNIFTLGVQNGTTPALSGSTSGSGVGTKGAALSGYGIYGTATSGTGGRFESSSGQGAYCNSSSGTGLYCSGSHALEANGVIIQTNGSGAANFNSTVPNVDNTYTCGDGALRWATVWAVNGTIQTSDSRVKTEIADSDLGLSFIMQLRPVSYKMKIGENVVQPDGSIVARAGVRRHYGLISQEVKSALGDDNIAMWVLTNAADADSQQALIYTELIAPLIKAVQELKAELDAYKASHP